MTLDEDLAKRIAEDAVLSRVLAKADSGTADFTDTSRYHDRMAEIVGAVMREHVLEVPAESRSALCERVLRARYRDSAELLSRVQEALDAALGIRLAPQIPAFQAERAKQIGNSLADQTVSDETIQRRAESASANVVRAFQDRYVQENVRFRTDAGLKCWIVRDAGAKCCDWCAGIDGKYEYGSEPKDVYGRHDNCTCTVTYENGRKRQDVWSKRTWEQPAPDAGASPPLTILTREQGLALMEQRRPKRFGAGLTGLTNGVNRATMEQEASPRKSKGGKFDADWSVIQSPEYSAKFVKLSANNAVSSSIETRAKWALNNRTGSRTEELYAISLADGREIARITDQHFDFGVKRTDRFTRRLNEADSNGEPILLLHNHPRGLPPSIGDINALLRNENVSGITVGHNGSIYRYTRPEREIPESDWMVELRNFKEFSEITSMEKALEVLSERYGFEFEIL